MTKDMTKEKNEKNKIEEKLIDKEMNLAEVIYKYPDVAEVFTDYGLHCVGCFAAGFDTIEMGAKIHQLSDEEVEEMVSRANEVALHQE